MPKMPKMPQMPQKPMKPMKSNRLQLTARCNPTAPVRIATSRHQPETETDPVAGRAGRPGARGSRQRCGHEASPCSRPRGLFSAAHARRAGS